MDRYDDVGLVPFTHNGRDKDFLKLVLVVLVFYLLLFAFICEDFSV